MSKRVPCPIWYIAVYLFIFFYQFGSPKSNCVDRVNALQSLHTQNLPQMYNMSDKNANLTKHSPISHSSVKIKKQREGERERTTLCNTHTHTNSLVKFDSIGKYEIKTNEYFIDKSECICLPLWLPRRNLQNLQNKTNLIIIV